MAQIVPFMCQHCANIVPTLCNFVPLSFILLNASYVLCPGQHVPHDVHAQCGVAPVCRWRVTIVMFLSKHFCFCKLHSTDHTDGHINGTKWHVPLCATLCHFVPSCAILCRTTTLCVTEDAILNCDVSVYTLCGRKKSSRG